MKAKEFDKKFEEGKSVLEYLNLAETSRPSRELKRISLNLPLWMANSLDREAKR